MKRTVTPLAVALAAILALHGAPAVAQQPAAAKAEEQTAALIFKLCKRAVTYALGRAQTRTAAEREKDARDGADGKSATGFFNNRGEDGQPGRAASGNGRAAR